MKKNKLKLIIQKILRDKKNHKQIIFFNSTKDIKKNSILVLKKNLYLETFMVFFYSILLNKKFEKNFFILFILKPGLITGNNFLPDWPGKYLSSSFLKNLLHWLKLFFKFFYYKKKICNIIFRYK